MGSGGQHGFFPLGQQGVVAELGQCQGRLSAASTGHGGGVTARAGPGLKPGGEGIANPGSQQPGRSPRKDGGLGPNDEAERQAGQPSYVVHIAITEKGIRTERGFSRLEPGMAVTAEIKTGERSVISFLLSPLQRLANESLRER